MKFLQKTRRILFYTMTFGVLVGLQYGCQSSSSSTNPATCNFSSGTYRYGLHMDLGLDPASFGDGSEEKSFWGNTYITVDGNNFSFRGGENNAWEIEGSCISGKDDSINITLHNNCNSNYLTSASSSMYDATQDGAQDGLHVISTYLIHWSCEGKTPIIARERWDLFLQ